MSPNQAERTVPEAIELAIERLKVAAYKAGRGDDDATDGTKEMASLYAAILAALEPERALRARAERLRQVILQHNAIGVEECYSIDELNGLLQLGDLVDDLTATSNAHEGREGGS